MSRELLPLIQIVRQDQRYPLEAYLFVREALAFASDGRKLDSSDDLEEELIGNRPVRKKKNQHMSGQELCEGIRRYAISQFGYLSKTVLNSWGIEKTSDLGDIVYNMIEAGIMKKSSKDHRSHFDDVYCFDEVFENQFEISMPAAIRRV